MEKVITLGYIKKFISDMKKTAMLLGMGEDEYFGSEARKKMFTVAVELMTKQILKDNLLTDDSEEAMNLPDFTVMSDAVVKYLVLMMAIIRNANLERGITHIPSMFLSDDVKLDRGDWEKSQEFLAPYCEFVDMVENLPEWLDWAQKHQDEIKKHIETLKGEI